VDEAYTEFAGPEHSLLSQLEELPNVAFIRTFSKLYGLAGLRIGYGILPPELADYMWRVRLPFSLNILAEEAAIAALGDEGFRSATLDLVQRGREKISEGLRAMGCEVVPSMSNFVMFRPASGTMEAKSLHAALLHKGIIIRALRSYHLDEWLRVTVGTDEENALFLQYTRELLEGGHA